MELVGPKYRVFGGLLISTFYACGEALLGVIAMFVHNWKNLLLISYAPSLIFFIYIWIIPESVLWLITQGHYTKAADIIHKVAKFNNKTLSQNTLKHLDDLKDGKTTITENSNSDSIQHASKETFLQALKNKIILLRLLNCSFCWTASTFVYYGLSIVSVTIGDNKYESFIYACLIEIPGYFACLVMAEKLGRVVTLSSSLILSGIACVGSIFIEDSSLLTLLLFLLGKFSITISFSILYTYTAELFPTSLRQRLFSVCTTVGRIGTILAPQAPLLADVAKSLPMIVFGSVALIAGILTLLLPETLKIDLPNTIAEASQMKSIKKVLVVKKTEKY